MPEWVDELVARTVGVAATIGAQAIVCWSATPKLAMRVAERDQRRPVIAASPATRSDSNDPAANRFDAPEPRPASLAELDLVLERARAFGLVRNDDVVVCSLLPNESVGGGLVAVTRVRGLAPAHRDVLPAASALGAEVRAGRAPGGLYRLDDATGHLQRVDSAGGEGAILVLVTAPHGRVQVSCSGWPLLDIDAGVVDSVAPAPLEPPACR